MIWSRREAAPSRGRTAGAHARSSGGIDGNRPVRTAIGSGLLTAGRRRIAQTSTAWATSDTRTPTGSLLIA